MAPKIFNIDDNNVVKDNGSGKANKTIKKIFKFRKIKLYYNIVWVLMLDLGFDIIVGLLILILRELVQLVY